MFDFHEKRKIRTIMYSKMSIVLLFFLAFFIGMSAYERYSVEREMAARLEARHNELESLKQRAAVLESDVEHLQNERGIEEELRSRFDVAKEGEQIVIILEDEEEKEVHTETEKKTQGTQETNGAWWDMLKFW